MAAGGLKVWNGSAWVSTTPKVWSGSAWTPVTTGSVWNGSSWIPFYTNSWTSGSSSQVYVYGGGGYTRTDTDIYYGVNTITSMSNFYYPGLDPAAGTGGPAGSNVGYSGNTVLGIFDYRTLRTQNPYGTGNYDYYPGSYLVFSGNVTGTFWNTVTANGVSKNRTAAVATSGTYNSGYDVTYWYWASSTFSFPSSGTFTVAFT
jgi:hypothetical protein